MKTPESTQRLCEHCKMDLEIRNPSGFCDHLYYPENCEVCAQTPPTLCDCGAADGQIHSNGCTKSAEVERHLETWSVLCNMASTAKDRGAAPTLKLEIQQKILSYIESLQSRNEVLEGQQKKMREAIEYSNVMCGKEDDEDFQRLRDCLDLIKRSNDDVLKSLS